jgi:NitT/TauT family transport system substrate-binding protein
MKRYIWDLGAAVAAVAIAVTLAVTVATASPSKHAARPRITIMVGGLSKIIYAPASLARTLGYYDKAGIDVYPIDEPAGVEATDALIAGQVDAALGYYNHAVDVAAKGKKLECVVQIGLTPGHAVVVPPDSPIKSAKDFKGHTLGITGIGSSTDFELQYLAKRKGVNGSDFNRLPVGAGNTFIAALQHHSIDGGITSQPTIGRLVKSGQAKIVIDLQNLNETKAAFGGTFPSACVYMRNDWVKTHQAKVQYLVNAYIWTLKWIAKHSAAAFADKMDPAYYAGDKDLYIQDLEQSATYFSKTGLMPKDGPPTIKHMLGTFEPDVNTAKFKLSDTYTNAFVEKALKTKVPKPK